MCIAPSFYFHFELFFDENHHRTINSPSPVHSHESLFDYSVHSVIRERIGNWDRFIINDLLSCRSSEYESQDYHTIVDSEPEPPGCASWAVIGTFGTFCVPLSRNTAFI